MNNDPGLAKFRDMDLASPLWKPAQPNLVLADMVRAYLPMAIGAKLFDVPLQDMTREELMASLIHLAMHPPMVLRDAPKATT